MKKLIYSGILALAVVLAFPLYVTAESATGMPQPSKLPKQVEITIPGYFITLYSQGALDEDYFSQALETDGSETSETIADKIDSLRLAAYPEQEIQMAIASQNDLVPTFETEKKFSFAGRISLVKSVYWWNNENSFGDYWYWCETASAASNFTHIMNGQYYIFRYRNNEWVHQTNSPFTAPHTTAQSTQGYPDLRCFGGVGNHMFNKAHVVMFFYDYVPENTGVLF